MTGQITSYSPKHGYGFIDGSIFFHIKQWDLRIPPVIGLDINYEVEETAKGQKAVNITRKEK